MSLNKIELKFKNGSLANLIAKNADGFMEIEILGRKMNEMVGRSYKEILEAEF